ncbi:hypothetical protein NCER_100503 [Vairimorpha ceranae BRL01]|uniref:NEDD8-activating enzyme E1 catalytic subunit n=1 Tax=Vairimorpha ceranae (strain BRL01) TaxID=578460 RepID=C4V7R5_VAIC1|nr:hypothetical protein NCER_100503 [Vairimorpha ceranae BRL01]
MPNIKNILVVGTGGIGSELVKLLYLLPESQISLIDFDTIELTNLNRQFLFTNNDIGKYKSEIVGNKIRESTNWKITSYTDSIYNYDLGFFKQFDVVYNCLDNNEARTYVNTRCYLGSVKLVDGGSGGFKGQSCIFDYTKECFDCLPKPIQKSYNVCTIRTLPTKFEHCIEFVKETFFNGEYNFNSLIKADNKSLYSDFILKLTVNNENNITPYKKDIIKIKKYLLKLKRKNLNVLSYNKDNIYECKLLYKLSCIRSKSANIELISFFDFQSIANNIIPSLCSTNAIVASLMILSERNNTHYFLTHNKKLFIGLDPGDKNRDCHVCSKKWIVLNIKRDSMAIELFDFINHLLNVNIKYLMTENGKFYSKFPNNLGDKLEINVNSVGTLGYNNEEILKVYFNELEESFRVIK